MDKDVEIIFDFSKYYVDMEEENKFKKGDTVHIVDKVTGLEVDKTVVDIKGNEIILG